LNLGGDQDWALRMIFVIGGSTMNTDSCDDNFGNPALTSGMLNGNMAITNSAGQTVTLTYEGGKIGPRP